MSARNYRLVIGNRNYSSWSLRAWLFMRASGISFVEIRIPMFTPSWAKDIARYSPASRVPVLLDGDLAVWDTSAIFQYVLERHAQAVGWPSDADARAHAQSISGEMHSGFIALRDELPQNVRARRKRGLGDLTSPCIKQIARVDAIWSECRERYAAKGPWLFGDFSLADVMYAPVALRFLTYDIPLSAGAAAFQRSIGAHPSVHEWAVAAGEESETIPFIDELAPAAATPMTLG